MEIRQITEDKDNYLEMLLIRKSAGEYDPAVSG